MHSLRVRLPVLIALVAALTLAGVGLSTTHFATVQLERLDTPPSFQGVASVQTNVRRMFLRSTTWAGTDSELESLSRAQHVELAVVSPDGRMLAASSQALRRARTSLKNGELHLSIESSPVGGASQGTDLIILRAPAAPLTDGAGHTIGFLYVMPRRLQSDPSPIAVSRSFARMLWLSIAGGAIVAVLVALLLSAQILRPVSALRVAAERMASGDLDARVATSGRDELAALGSSFNRLAQALSQTEALRRRMVVDIAHELRTPLTNIRAHIEAVQDGRLAPDAATLSSLLEEALLIEHLVGDLADTAVAEAGKLDLSIGIVAAGAAIEAACASFAPRAEAKGVRILVLIPPNVPAVRADPARLGQILRNLLANAVAHVNRNGSIDVSTCSVGEDVEFAVSNAGEPVAADELPLIFERFYRTDASRSRASGGAGLGLAIVKYLVEAQGGRVWAENTEPPGLALHFILPAAHSSDRLPTVGASA
jgi:signal transduction histidine kinase